MQVSSSVNARYYTSYQKNKNVKYCAGFSRTEDGKMMSGETTENSGFAEFADHQEFHKEWMSQSRTDPYQYARKKDIAATDSDMGAVTIAETEDEGEFLGLTMVPEKGQAVTYGMRAMLSGKSTPDNPIVQVVSNLGGEKVIYNVEVNKVNPNNATMLEMFALLSYTDKMGITDGGTFGSHQQLEVYGGNASSIGYCNSFSGADAFLNERFDWKSIMEKMVQVYLDAGIDKQAEDCRVLADSFGAFSEAIENAKTEKRISGRYTAASTQENPIVEVSLQIGEETITQEINIGEVNPKNATQLEMYAFFYHQDMLSGNEEANTYQKFSEYVENAVQNGHFEGNQSFEEFTTKEHNWQKVIISMWDDYSDAGIYSQMQECIKLNDVMEKASIQFVDFDKATFVDKSSEVFFTYPGINIPEQIQIAWMETAGAMEDTERYGYLTRVLYRRIEKELEGKEAQDESDVIETAIEAVKRALQDLEDTPTDAIANQPDTKKEVQELKSYYEAFLQKLEALKENSAEATDHPEITDGAATDDINVIYREFIVRCMEQIFVKIQNGDTEPTYQIGAHSFTEKEWKEFFDKFDSIQEAIQELIKEEQARKEAEEVKKGNMVISDADTLLTTESTSCVYETADPDDEDLRYITWYTGEGIFCRKAGQTKGYEWSIAFENREQYDKVMEFIGQFPSDWNMRFAAHENFWNDFLSDEIDMDGFMEFIGGTNKGVPDFSITVGDSMYIDKDKMQWAKYTNPLGVRFYTAEEMHRMQMEIIAANTGV